MGPKILCIESHKEFKFTCKRSILMEFPGLISLLELIPILESTLITFPEQIVILRSIPIPDSELTPQSAPESESVLELIPNKESDSGRPYSVLPPLLCTLLGN